MIKSRPQAALIQGAFRCVHVSCGTEITIEFSSVGIQRCREGAIGSLHIQGPVGRALPPSPTRPEPAISPPIVRLKALQFIEEWVQIRDPQTAADEGFPKFSRRTAFARWLPNVRCVSAAKWMPSVPSMSMTTELSKKRHWCLAAADSTKEGSLASFSAAPSNSSVKRGANTPIRAGATSMIGNVRSAGEVVGSVLTRVTSSARPSAILGADALKRCLASLVPNMMTSRSSGWCERTHGPIASRPLLPGMRGSSKIVVLPRSPSSITVTYLPSRLAITPVQRTSAGNRSLVTGSCPQVLESPKQSSRRCCRVDSQSMTRFTSTERS